MKPAAFSYHRPTTLDAAVTALAELGDDAAVLAGGQSLVPLMNLRLARPTALVDVTYIPGLAGVHVEGRHLLIGATTRHQTLAALGGRDATSRALAEAAAHIGHLPIRTRGTFGGSLAHGDSTAEWCVMALALGADLTATGPDGERTIPVDTFFTGPYQTALRTAEVLVQIRLERVDGAALEERAPRRGDFATVVVGVGIDLDGRRVGRARIAIGGVGPTPLRVPCAEAELVGVRAGGHLAGRAGAAAAAEVDPQGDTTATATQRRRLVRGLVERAVVRALARADDRAGEAVA